MKSHQVKSGWAAGLVCAGIVGWCVGALAQDEAIPAEDPVAVEETVVPAEEPSAPAAETEPVAVENPASPSEEPATAPVETAPATEPAAGTEVPAAEETPAKPPKAATVYRGSDMNEAFKGAGSSKFGASGRVNKIPAKKSVKTEKGAWKRSIEAGMSTASGNSDVLRYDGSASASKETDDNYFFLEAGGRYGESDNETDAANATIEAKVQHRLSERTYAALDGHVRHDQIADLSYRARGSLSLGRHFIWSDRVVLSAEAGPGYVAEKKGGEKEGFVAGRVGQYLEILLTDSLQIWESADFVQNLEDSAVYFGTAEVGLETVLVGNLNLRLSLEDTYDSQPAEDKVSNDLTTKTTLVWRF